VRSRRGSPSYFVAVPVHVVAARLGHADPAVTLRVYSHVLREHTAGVGDIFAQAVKSSR
jgi:integrase